VDASCEHPDRPIGLGWTGLAKMDPCLTPVIRLSRPNSTVDNSSQTTYCTLLYA